MMCINLSIVTYSKLFLVVGSYMYIETSSPRQYGDIAKLDFSVPSSDKGKLSCLKFYYHMYGDTVNTLNVYNGNTTIFTKSGNHGNQWMVTKVSMTLQSNVSYIYFFTMSFILYLNCIYII